MSDQPPPDAPAEAAGPAQEKAAAEPEQPAQEPWAARRDLDAHTPPSMVFDGINQGVTAHQVIGDIISGGKTEIHYEFGGFGGFGGGQVSGEIPAGTLERLADSFVCEGTAFGSLLERLRHEHVLVLTGAPFTGRRTAALMLLHRLGAAPVHAMDREVTPSELSRRFVSTGEAHGHVLCDLEPSREQPLREAHLLALRGQLREQNAYLVITTGHSPYIEDTVRLADWQAPAPETVLSTLLHRHLGRAEAQELLARPAVTEFLSRGHQIREVVGYAAVLLRADETEMEQYSLVTLERQVQEWFEEADNRLHLREKAFLIALAAFDNGPYALTAELSDTLYSALLRTGDDRFQKAIPVFGTHIAKRLQIARARRYTADEQTEWGPVTQLKAAFLDDPGGADPAPRGLDRSPGGPARPDHLARRSRRRWPAFRTDPGGGHRGRPRLHRPSLHHGVDPGALGACEGVPAPAHRGERPRPRPSDRRTEHPADHQRLERRRPGSQTLLGRGPRPGPDRPRASGRNPGRPARTSTSPVREEARPAQDRGG